MLVKLLQTFDGISLEPSAQPPDSLPPPEWKEISGRPQIERIVLQSHLTMYAYVSLDFCDAVYHDDGGISVM